MALTKVTSAVLNDNAVTSAKLDTNIAITGNLIVDTDTLYVDSTNNRVGIGTTSPAYKLVVNGIINIPYSGTNSNYFGTNFAFGYGRMYPFNGSGFFSFDTNYSSGIGGYQFNYNGTERMRITGGGDISFRDTSNNEAFYWDASAASLGIGTTSARSIFETNGTISINDSRTSITTGDTLAGIDIYTSDFSYNPPSGRLSMPINRILPVVEHSEGDAFGMAFYTAAKDADSVEQMRITSGGDLQVAGDVVAASTAFSDERLKDNIKPIKNSLEAIKKLNGVTYDWKANGKSSVGVIAQNIQEVFPELVKEVQPIGEDEKRLTVNYDGLIGVLIEAVKDLSAQINNLNK